MKKPEYSKYVGHTKGFRLPTARDNSCVVQPVKGASVYTGVTTRREGNHFGSGVDATFFSKYADAHLIADCEILLNRALFLENENAKLKQKLKGKHKPKIKMRNR